MAGADRAEGVARERRLAAPGPGTARLRLPPILLGLVALAFGLWAGLDRLGWALPLPTAALEEAHGPLMISGVLASLIGVERAVGLQRPILLLAPLGGAVGAILLVFGQTFAGEALVNLGAAGLVLMFAEILGRQSALYSATQLGGAVALAAGDLYWMGGGSVIEAIVPWWIAFLVLVIGGERLELSRLLRLPPLAQGTFVATALALPIACTLSLLDLRLGYEGVGVGLIAWALWLGRYDLARRTVHASGAPRFMAVALLTGYGWLGIAGGLALWTAPVEGGLLYDATLHSVFLGFVLSMILAHSLVIFPSVLRRAVPFSWPFYAPLGLLHASVALRVGADLAGRADLQAWAGLLNVATIVLFAAILAGTLIQARRGEPLGRDGEPLTMFTPQG